MVRKEYKEKKIFVSILSNELIKNKQSDLDGLSILYGGKTVENLTVTKLTFWNSSIPTINNSDLIPNAPFTISLKNGIILDVSVLKGDSSSNLIKAIYLNEHTVKISFEYLDRKEGGIIQIIHTGTEDSFDVSKQIKGGYIKKQKTNYLPVIICFSTYVISIILILCILTPLSQVSPLLTSYYEQAELFTLKSQYEELGFIVVCIIMTLPILYSIIKLFKEFTPKNCKR